MQPVEYVSCPKCGEAYAPDMMVFDKTQCAPCYNGLPKDSPKRRWGHSMTDDKDDIRRDVLVAMMRVKFLQHRGLLLSALCGDDWSMDDETVFDAWIERCARDVASDLLAIIKASVGRGVISGLDSEEVPT